MHLIAIAVLFLTQTSLAEPKIIKPKDLPKYVGKKIVLQGKASYCGGGPYLKMEGGPDGPGPDTNMVYVGTAKKPQKLIFSPGQGRSVVTWPDEVYDKTIEVEGTLSIRKSPEGFVNGGGDFIKYDKQGPGEYVLENFRWNVITILQIKNDSKD